MHQVYTLAGNLTHKNCKYSKEKKESQRKNSHKENRATPYPKVFLDVFGAPDEA